MPIDPERALAVTIEPVTMTIERGRLRAFAQAIGETDPVYLHADAAKAAGHRDIPAPPTFLFSVELESDRPFGYLDDLDIDLRSILHGEQTFSYLADVYAGDTITCEQHISEAYAKSPRMDFIVKHNRYLRGDELVAEADSLIIVRTLELA